MRTKHWILIAHAWSTSRHKHETHNGNPKEIEQLESWKIKGNTSTLPPIHWDGTSPSQNTYVSYYHTASYTPEIHNLPTKTSQNIYDSYDKNYLHQIDQDWKFPRLAATFIGLGENQGSATSTLPSTGDIMGFNQQTWEDHGITAT